MTKQLPLNTQSIVLLDSGVHTGLYGKGKYVSTIYVDNVCDFPNCRFESEHVTFDGQIFYRKKSV